MLAMEGQVLTTVKLTNQELNKTLQFVRCLKSKTTRPNTTNDAGAIANGQWWSPYSS